MDYVLLCVRPYMAFVMAYSIAKSIADYMTNYMAFAIGQGIADGAGRTIQHMMWALRGYIMKVDNFSILSFSLR